MKKIVRISAILITTLWHQQNLFATSLIGTSTPIFQNQHYVFRNGNIAQGYVRLNNGFTILAGAKVSLDTFITVSGAIDLRTTGILDLRSNLYLDANVTWSSSGSIFGRGNTINLDGNLYLPNNTTLQCIDDTIINGHGHQITFGPYAQLTLASNVSLTLRNLTIQTTINYIPAPFITFTSPSSQLTLDNVTLNLANDFQFNSGELFFMNDVVIAGTSQFIYQSAAPSTIMPQSTLTFNPGTTFYYNPPSTSKDLINLADKSSGIYLKGSDTTLQITPTGLRLTKGRLWVDNKVTFATSVTTSLSSVGNPVSISADDIKTAAISPNNQYIAYIKKTPITLMVDTIAGSAITSISVGVAGADSYARWPPNGSFIAVGRGSTLLIYYFDGSSLTQVFTTAVATTSFSRLAWSPNGNYLAYGSGSTNSLSIYRITYAPTSATATLVTSANPSGNVFDISWHPSGNIIATGSDLSGNVQLYSFNGTTLTTLTSQTGLSNQVYARFDSTGTYLAVSDNSSTFRIYSFNGTTLSLLASITLPGSSTRGISWNPISNVVAVAIDQGNIFQIYQLNQATLTPLTTITAGGNPSDIFWAPNGQNLAFATDNGLTVYGATYVSSSGTQALTNSLVFGNSSLGSTYDLDVYLQAGARIELDGKLFCNNVN